MITERQVWFMLISTLESHLFLLVLSTAEMASGPAPCQLALIETCRAWLCHPADDIIENKANYISTGECSGQSSIVASCNTFFSYPGFRYRIRVAVPSRRASSFLLGLIHNIQSSYHPDSVQKVWHGPLLFVIVVVLREFFKTLRV